jgi:hypothetical protein
LIDIWSPLNLTSWAVKDISSLIGFIGFVVLVGTILGVIIDGLHHSIIEGIIFKNFFGLKKIDELLKALYPRNEDLKYSYFYKMIGDKAIDFHEFLINAQYRYSEFYANTFISLVPLSVIAPFYLFYVLQIPWKLAVYFFIIPLVIACCCLSNSYRTLKNYENSKLSFIYGHLDYGYYVDFSLMDDNRVPIKDTVPIENTVYLEARIVDKKSIYKSSEGIKIVFGTSFGNLDIDSGAEKDCIKKYKEGKRVRIIIKTDREGKARAKLISDVPGTAILTASSYECLPAIASVKFVKDYKRR